MRDYNDFYARAEEPYLIEKISVVDSSQALKERLESWGQTIIRFVTTLRDSNEPNTVFDAQRRN